MNLHHSLSVDCVFIIFEFIIDGISIEIESVIDFVNQRHE